MRAITLKMMVQYNYYKRTRSSRRKNVGKKYFETKILITKIYNTSNECDAIVALLAPLDRNREKDRELFTGSNEKVCACGLGIVSK